MRELAELAQCGGEMREILEKLLTLQDRDQRIRAFEQELAQVPLEKAARERQLQESARRLEKAKERLKQIEVEKKALEVEAGAKRSAIERFKAQQLQTRKNEEYAALQHEISAAEAAIVALEDREIALMEEAERLGPQIREAEAEHAGEREKIERAMAAIAAKVPNIEARIAELREAREKVASQLDEEVLDIYQRLFKNKAGSAVVALEGGVCTGCHMKVTHQTAIEVKAGKGLVHCPNCGRILYLPA